MLPANLISLPMNEFDVILGMDWLAGYHAVMDCFNKIVKLKVDDIDKKIQFVGVQKKIKTHVISTLKVAH